ncbi:Rid family hydrolase [Mesorhizobium sp. A556]
MSSQAAGGASAANKLTGDPFSEIVDVDGRLFLQSLTAADAGDAAAQVSAIVRKAEILLDRANATLRDIRKMIVNIVEGADRESVLSALKQYFPRGLPGLTLFIANGLSDPEASVQIDFDAVRASGEEKQVSFPRTVGAVTVSRIGNEVFLSAIDGLADNMTRRSLADAAAQAELAMSRLSEALEAVGASVEDVCKITVHLPDRYYREGAYPQIGRRLGAIYPVSTGLIVQGLCRPGALFSIDVLVQAGNGAKHQRNRKYQTGNTLYGQLTQKLDCGFCMSILAGDRVFLRGQTGMNLEGILHEQADVAVQSEQAMENVVALLADVGADLNDVAKATLFVTDPAYLEPSRVVLARYLKDIKPAFSAVVVKGLAAPKLLMEVDIFAIRKNSS